MPRKDCPCLGCVPPKRHEACHDSCEAYKDWVRPIVQDRERRVIFNQVRDILKTKVQKCVDKNAMWRKRGR